MRNRRFRYEPIKVEVTREEILADLLYPVATAGERPSARRTPSRRTKRQPRR
jgi:hypothetical protein